jgi:hypothetical protein
MAIYALQTAYTPVGWAALLKDPQNRMEAVKPIIQRLGGGNRGWLADIWRIRRADDLAVKAVKTMPQFAIKSAFLLGAERVIAIDTVPERLALAAPASRTHREG